MGEGSYGTVIKGFCRNSGVQVAIKLIKNFTRYDYDCVKLVREIQLMKSLNELSEESGCCFVPELIDIIVPKS